MRITLKNPLKLSILLLVVAMFACGRKNNSDPIAGRWVWFNNPTVYIDANGDLRLPDKGVSGHWHVLEKPARKYELDWTSGYIDHLTLSADGKSLEGTNQNGTRVTATRAP